MDFQRVPFGIDPLELGWRGAAGGGLCSVGAEDTL